MRALKQQISIYVKGHSLSQYHTAQSSQGTLFSVEYLTTHLIYIITNMRSTGQEFTKLQLSAPRKKNLPALGIEIVHVRGKKEEDNAHAMELEDRSLILRSEMIAHGKLDEMSKLQPSSLPTLKLGDRMQHAFRFIDEENNNKETLEQCIGTVTALSTGESLYQGVKPHRKNTAVEVKQDSNSYEDSSATIVEMKKSMFNMCLEYSWRLFLMQNGVANHCSWPRKDKNKENRRS